MLIHRKEETDQTTIKAGDFNTILKSMARSSRQKIRERAALKDTLDHMDLKNIYSTLSQNSRVYILFKCT